MKKVLYIKSSILKDYSTSTKYADKLLKSLGKVNIKVRDVAENQISILNNQNLNDRNLKSGSVYQEHMELIKEVKEADVIVITAPMYNFTIPIQLHAYFDAIAIASESFHYENDGTQVGHIKNKEVYVVISSGGIYKENGLSFQEEYIRTFLNFLGLDNIKFIFIEGVSMGKSEDQLNTQFEKQI